jgi:hypothetical protein
MRNNVAITVLEHYGDIDIVVGAAYYADKKIIPLDGLNLTLSTDVKEFHWKANDLSIYLTQELQYLINTKS